MNAFSSDIGRLIIYIDRTRKQFMDDRLRDEGLNGPPHLLLLGVTRSPGVNQDALSCRYLLDKGTVARAAKQLEDEGYILRETDPDDRRANLLYPTAKGTFTAERIRTQLGEWSDELTQGLSDDDRQLLIRLLTRMAENYA